MAEHHTYDHIVKQKLNQLVVPDMESMWGDMRSILEREMPQEKKKRFGWFFLRNNFYLLLAFAILGGTVSFFAIKRSNEQMSLTNEKHLITDQTSNSVAQTFATEETKGTANSSTEFITGKKSTTVSTSHTTKQHQIRRSVAADDLITGTSEDADHTVTKTGHDIPSSEIGSLIAIGSRYDLQIPSREHVAIIDQKTIKPIANQIFGVNQQPVIDDKQLIIQPGNRIAMTSTQQSKEVSSTETLSDITINNATAQYQILSIGIQRLTETVSLITGLNDNDRSLRISKVPVNDSDMVLQRSRLSSKNFVIAGLSLNYHMPVSGQEMSTITGTGKAGKVLDYLPSIYAQYHFADKWFVQAELQYKAPQFVAPIRMQSTFTPVNNNKKYEEWSTLSKLYYMNLPVSVHYKVSNKVTAGAGVQYSYLRSSVIETNLCTWEKNNNNSWDKSYTSSKVHIKKNPRVEKKNNGNGSAPATMTQVDTLAQSMRGNDWRLMFDVNYRWNKITAGVKFTAGINNYIQVNTGGVASDVKDKNQAVQFYLRYDLFRSDRKRKQ